MHAFAEPHGLSLPLSPGRGAAFLLGKPEFELLARVEEESCSEIPLLCVHAEVHARMSHQEPHNRVTVQFEPRLHKRGRVLPCLVLVPACR